MEVMTKAKIEELRVESSMRAYYDKNNKEMGERKQRERFRSENQREVDRAILDVNQHIEAAVFDDPDVKAVRMIVRKEDQIVWGEYMVSCLRALGFKIESKDRRDGSMSVHIVLPTSEE